MKDEKRKKWIDLLRAFAIISIVFGHVIVHSNKLTPIYRYLNSYHVPIFFVISGFLFNNNKISFKQFFIKKFKRIMIPYFVFAILFLIPYIIFGTVVNQNLYGNNKFDLAKSIFGILYGNGHNSLLKQNSALWFFPCLFVVEMIHFLFEQIRIKYYNNIKRENVYIIALIAFVLIGYLNYKIPHVRLPWGIDIAIVMMTFVMLGKLLSIYYKRLNEYTFSILLILVGMILNCFNGEIACMKHEYGIYFIFILSASMTCTGLTLLFSKFENNSLIEYIGRNTIGILIFHKLIIVIAQTKLGIISKLLKNGNLVIQITISIVVFVISLFTSLVATEITKRVIPEVLGENKKQ